MRFVRSLPADETLISNEEMALLYLTQHRVYPLAEIYADKPLFPFTRYGDGSHADMGQVQFKEQAADLVLFNSIYDQLRGLYHDDTQERIQVLTRGLTVIYQGEDGTVYRYPATVEE